MATHYDTLKVTQDAPAEVITAAYKALAGIYHPDRNLNNPDAAVKMQNLNVAYKILSDPQKRAEHDAWINSQERRGNRPPLAAPPRRRAAPDEKAKAEKTSAEAAKWAAWAEKTAQDVKDAQKKLDKALEDLAKAKEADRAKWEAWVAKMKQDVKEAQDRADKAMAQAQKSATDAVEASTKTQ